VLGKGNGSELPEVTLFGVGKKDKHVKGLSSIFKSFVKYLLLQKAF
jgi:hypothetical protein